ncbi:MAG: hypothetical protein ACRDK9_13065 [Solirubrobacterales bacterium]
MLVLLATAVAAGADTGDRGGPPPPEISGEPHEGETLFASWFEEPDQWQWQRCTSGEVVCKGIGRGSPWTTIPGADEDTYVLRSADVGNFVRVGARNCPKGCNDFTFSDPVGPIEPAVGPPPPPPPGGPPPPVAHVSANLAPLQGTILVKLPGTDFFIPITQATQVPLGTVVDARDGHVEVFTARNEQGAIQSGEFWAGVFKLTQTDGAPLVTRFKLVGPGEQAGRAQRGRGGRRLWGRGRCKCRSRGRHSAGTVRGTWWLTQERPNGTFTRVKRGKVAVRDFGRRKTILVRAGERYLAKPGRN